MAGFAAYAGGELARVLNGVAAFLAPAVDVTAHAVLVLGVVLGWDRAWPSSWPRPWCWA